jgi:hypothetical protein
MEKSAASTGHSSGVRDLRTGKIRATPNSASAIRQSVGVRPSEAKVAAKALQIVVKSSETKASKKVSIAKSERFSEADSRDGKTS